MRFAVRISVSVVGLIALIAIGATTATAHDGKKHPTPNPESASGEATSGAKKDFGIKIGGVFSLIDHLGNPQTDRDYHGGYLLVFFGYADCESICPVGLKRMTDAVDVLGEAGDTITPRLITVDPKRDSPAVLAAEVARIHPRLVCLTGTEAALVSARKAYNVKVKAVEGEWGKDAVLAHGSFVYLIGKRGEFLTLLPPVFGADQMAKTIREYLDAPKS
jgi:protein SCO1/2